MSELIALLVKEQRGSNITTESAFRRIMRGKDGTGYDFLTDEEVGRIWLCYMMNTAE